jgi:uncharacterized protein YggL (DUF469 family)
MRKRLRKKRRLGECRQFGFEVDFRLTESMPGDKLDEFWERVLGDLIEQRRLSCGGACGRAWSIFVTPAGRRSATDEDRTIVESWLGDEPQVVDVRVGPLVDAWHSA